MNIFILDSDHDECARAHIDKHVVKMPLEAAQILCTVMVRNGMDAVYKPTHTGHPCVRWADKSTSNFEWVREYGLALCREYTYRYGKVHKCQQVIENVTTPDLPDGITPHVQCMPEVYKQTNPVLAYRAYYLGDKREIASWKRRPPPMWWKEK